MQSNRKAYKPKPFLTKGNNHPVYTSLHHQTNRSTNNFHSNKSKVYHSNKSTTNLYMNKPNGLHMKYKGTSSFHLNRQNHFHIDKATGLHINISSGGGNRKKKFCKRCQRYGNHTEVLCNEPVIEYCCFCGQDHRSPSISCNSMKCLNCSGFHPGETCEYNAKDSFCTICNLAGHSDEMCTNNWRIFHSVKSIDDLDKLKVSAPLRKDRGICTTCGSSLHAEYECSENKNTVHYYNPNISIKQIEKIKNRYIEILNNKSSSSKSSRSTKSSTITSADQLIDAD